MAGNGLDGPNGSNGSGPFRSGPRHRLTRSITESASLPTTSGRLLFGQMGSSGAGAGTSTSANTSASTTSNSQHLQFQFPRRDRNDERALPANPSVRGSLDLPRFDGVSPNRTPSRTPSHSRKTSLLVSSAEESGTMASPQNHGTVRATPVGRTSEANVKEQARKRLTGLKKSFFDLNAYLTATNQRIYDTYYSVLEKTQALQSAITTLSELRELSHGVNEAFDRDTASIEQEVQQQLDALGSFEPQQRRIEALQTRIKNGRSRVVHLGERVDSMRKQVEGWERKDAEWQERTRRRLKVIWILTLVAFFAVVVLMMGAQLYGHSGGDVGPRATLDGRGDAAASDILRVLDEL